MKLTKEHLATLKNMEVILQEATFKDADAAGMIQFVKCLGWLQGVIKELSEEIIKEQKKQGQQQEKGQQDADRRKRPKG